MKSTLLSEPNHLKKWEDHFNSFVRKNPGCINWQKFVDSNIFSYSLLDVVPTGGSILYLWYLLSKRHDLTLEIIEQNIDKPWHWNEIETLNIITPDFIDKHHMIGFNYRRLSESSTIPFDYIIKNYERGWNWRHIRTRFYLTDDEIIANFDKPWMLRYIEKGCLSEKVARAIYSYPDFANVINWNDLTLYTSMEVILKTSDLPWNFNSVIRSCRPSLKDLNEHHNIFSRFRHVEGMETYVSLVIDYACKKSGENSLKYNNFNDDTIKFFLEELRTYPKVEWRWNIIANIFPLRKMDFLLASDINSGWRITSMIRHKIITLDYIKSKFPVELKILCETNYKIKSMNEESSLYDTPLTSSIISFDHMLLTECKINAIKKNFIINLIMEEGVIEFKRKIKEVNNEFNEKICNPTNMVKLRELQIFDFFN